MTTTAVRAGELCVYLDRQFNWNQSRIRGVALPSKYQSLVDSWCWLRSVTVAHKALVLNLSSAYSKDPDPILAREFYDILMRTDQKAVIVLDIEKKFYAITSYETCPNAKSNKHFEIFLGYAQNSLRPISSIEA